MEKELLDKIKIAFPIIPMPEIHELGFHTTDCFQCDELSRELNEFRLKPVTSDVIRYVHQDMSCLSAKGWAWILPHYLPYCLTQEAAYNQMEETEFLLYNLAPDEEFKSEAILRLSALSGQQIRCLISFVVWMQKHPHWSNYCPEEIDKALEFLRSLERPDSNLFC